ncbi:GNAT family N-acetyltransferase [Acidovorax facilis]|uniref:GNAT family N-acetyltransferase n=1 Tax=Acidovorax facilis TaxID=12917 RepID=UPI003CFB1E34
MPQGTQIIPVGPEAAEAACTVIRQSITHCCVLDHANDPAILTAWLVNKTPENLAAWMSAPGAAVWGAHRGVGHALLREAEAHARQSRLAALGLESTRTAEAFYRRNGYEPAGAVQSWAGLQAQPMRKVF